MATRPRKAPARSPGATPGGAECGDGGRGAYLFSSGQKPSLETASPPLRVQRAERTGLLVWFLRKWTEPSQKRALTPPGCCEVNSSPNSVGGRALIGADWSKTLCPLTHMALIASGSSPTWIVQEEPSVISARVIGRLKI